MKTNKKIIALIVTGVIFGGGINGYASEKGNENTIASEGYEQLSISSPANDVVIKETNDKKVTASMAGHKGTLLKKDGKKLSITVPEPKAGLHLKAPKVLYVNVPKKNNLSIHVTSEAGNVKLDGVRGKEIKVEVEAGKISAANLSGKLSAKTEIGEISVPSTAKNAVNQTQTGGATYQGNQGNSSDGVITLNNEAGEIEIN